MANIASLFIFYWQSKNDAEVRCALTSDRSIDGIVRCYF